MEGLIICMALRVDGRPSFVLNYIHFPPLSLLPRAPFGFRLFSDRIILTLTVVLHCWKKRDGVKVGRRSRSQTARDERT